MKFSVGFEKILDMCLPDGRRLKDLISEIEEEFLTNRKKIIEGSLPEEPVKLAISFICSRSGRWAALDTKVRKQLENKNPFDLLKEGETSSFLDGIYGKDSKARKDIEVKIGKFLRSLKDLENRLRLWPEKERLKRFEQEFKEILMNDAKIGKKGCDNLLRDCGFIDYVPIDVHEERFLLRTGIFHKHASTDKYDPTDYEHLSEAMKAFCRKELKNLRINKTSLSDAPGLVDLIIWYFSQEKTEQKKSLGVCAKVPKCNRCPLTSICLFAKLHSHLPTNAQS